jgi:hypothetical protein
MTAFPNSPLPFEHWIGTFWPARIAGMKAQKIPSPGHSRRISGKSWSRMSGRHTSFTVTTSGPQVAMTRRASGTACPPS